MRMTITIKVRPGGGDFSFDWGLVQPSISEFAIALNELNTVCADGGGSNSFRDSSDFERISPGTH